MEWNRIILDLHLQNSLLLAENRKLISQLQKQTNELDLQTQKENTPKQKKQQRKPKRNQKPYGQLKHAARTEIKRKIEAKFREASEHLHEEISSVKVELKFNNGKVMSFFPRSTDAYSENAQLQQREEEESNQKIVHQILAVKDRFRISDEALHELHMIGKKIPSKNRIQEEKYRLNTVIPIYSYPSASSDCAYRKLFDVLSHVLKKQHALMEDRHDVHVHLRFACNGAKITKKLNSVRGVVKILTPRDHLPEDIAQLSMSPDDELTLFFFIGDESRATIQNYGKETFLEMKALTENNMEFMGKTVILNWLLTCDWKALALLKGINAANSEYFCLWCHCSKKQICDFSIPSWPIPRSLDDQKLNLPSKKMGYVADDICSFIEYSNMVPDDLHLRIRISLKLFNQIMTWAVDQKSEEKLKKEMNRIGVCFLFWEERGDDNSNTSVKKWSQPSGDDLKTIIKNLQIHNVLDGRSDKHLVNAESLTMNQLRDELTARGLSRKGKKCDLVSRLKEVLGNGNKVLKRSSRSRLRVSYDYRDDEEEAHNLDVDGLQELWSDYDDLMEALHHLPTSEKYKSPNTFMAEAKQWASNFRKYTFDEDVTPYIHALVYHVPYFLDKYKYLHDIGVAQVERKNFDHRQAYFGSTNRNGSRHKKKISLQILQRENRMLWLAQEGVERKKRAYKKK